MTNQEKETFKKLKEALYSTLESQINELTIKSGPNIVALLKTNAKELFTDLDNEIDFLVDLDEESIENLLNLTTRFYIQALIFQVADDSFFDE